MTATQIHGLETLFDELLDALETCQRQHVIPTLNANDNIWSEQDAAKVALEQKILAYRHRLRELLDEPSTEVSDDR